ncbi:MAG: hypothetical protein CM1200mP30_08200 [Pseudomonadota bacterium]|nr:MAG: hypothetical protein CM1200mP30_08200 [Pseudomonadota bacterium]
MADQSGQFNGFALVMAMLLLASASLMFPYRQTRVRDFKIQQISMKIPHGKYFCSGNDYAGSSMCSPQSDSTSETFDYMGSYDRVHSIWNGMTKTANGLLLTKIIYPKGWRTLVYYIQYCRERSGILGRLSPVEYQRVCHCGTTRKIITMNNPAQKSRKRRKRRSMLLPPRIIIILILTLGTVFHGLLYAQEKPLLVFTDNDSRGGFLKGDLIFTVPKIYSSKQNSAEIKDYVLHWGNNPHQRLGMFRPIATLPGEKPGSRMRLQFKNTPVPQSATHLLLYSRNEFGNETEIYSLRLIDKGVPENKAQDILFEQTGKEGNRVQGEILITRAWDERDVTHYAIYWGEGPDIVLRSQPSVAVIEKRFWFGSLGVQFFAPWRASPLTEKIDILLPPEATHFIVFTRNSEGQMSEGKSMKIQGMQQEEKAEKLKMILQKKSSASGFINGNLKLVRSKFEDDFSHYLFFWGKDELTRLGGHPPFAQIEVKKFKDGLTDKEIQVSTISQMDQEIEVKTEGKARPELRYEFPENTIIPTGATHILVYTQKKFWFQDDAERRLKGPMANVSIMDPEGSKKKEKVLG